MKAMKELKEMYAKVHKLNQEIEESDQLCRTAIEQLQLKNENHNRLIQQRKYWLERIDHHKMLTNYLQSKADERKAKEEAERKAEEEARLEAAHKTAEEAERKAKEEAENARKRRPIAKSSIFSK